MKFYKKPLKLAVLFPLFLLSACGQGDAEGEFDSLIQQHMQQGHLPGLMIGIVNRNGLQWSKGYGYADIEQQIPATIDTILPIASISKTVTATGMMQAVEGGTLSLDRDINDYLPFKVDNPHVDGEKITLRHLATHMSGIDDNGEVYNGPASYHWEGDNPIILGDFLQNYFVEGREFYSKDKNFHNRSPGEAFDYSNVGAGLLAHVVENVTAAPFNRYTKAKIFDPLGMSSTGWFLSEIDQSRRAKLYKYKAGELVAFPPYGLATWPDGGVRTTVRDLARFLAMVMGEGSLEGERVLSQDGVKVMLAGQSFDGRDVKSIHGSGKQGLFWFEERFSDLLLMGHSGSDPGVKTQMFFDPDRDIGVIIFTNANNGDDTSERLVEILLETFAQADALIQ